MNPVEPESNPVQDLAGPYHDFWLLSAIDVPPRAGTYQPFVGRRDAPIRLADDLLRFELGALKAVPCRNPASPDESVGMGLNLYGPSWIFEDGAATLEAILTSAIERLAALPEVPVLSLGTWTLSDALGKSTTAPRPHRVRIDRQAIVEQLSELATMARWVQRDEDAYLLHLGI